MTPHLRTMLLTWFAVLMSACTNEGTQTHQPSSTDLSEVREHASRFFPKDAVNVGSATEMSWIQESFDVSREPFQFAVSTELLAHAKSDGWTLCQQLDQQWMGFEDATVTPSRYVRQKAYVLHKQGTLITLIGRYYGDTEAALARQLETTEKVTQHLAVIARPSTDREASDTADSLGLSCDQTALPR